MYIGAGIVVYDNIKRKVLLVCTRDCGKWGPPKGAKEMNESRFECAKRELYEETGLTLRNTHSRHFIRIVCDECHIYVVPYNCTKNNINVHDVNEISDCKWFDIEKLPCDIHNSNRILRLLCKRRKDIIM